ncbi:MAG: zinc ribbon domain-containing protein [Candidatus Lokiarchaeota archaeon]|nr:zinc ribbon domain-containing protein [Candidatus Lokiarchaeota archaeon]
MRERIKKNIKIVSVIGFIIFGVTVIVLAAHIQGHERSIRVEKDSYVAEDYPDINYGADDFLHVGNYSNGKVQTFYFFNISSLPDGWSEVEIHVKFDYGSGMVDIGANLTYEIWDEMTITWNNKPKAIVYRGHILCDGFDFRIPLRKDQIIDDGIGVCLYARDGEADEYIRGNSREGASSNNDRALIELKYIGIDPSFISAALMTLSIVGIIVGVFIGIVVLSILLYSNKQKSKKKVVPHVGAVNNNALGANWLNTTRYKSYEVATLEKVINQYITLKLVNGRSFIYVSGKRFIQCIRLILNIPKADVPIYDEVDSIDEAANLYSKHIFQNRIVRGPMAIPVPDQRHEITPEQEFWGHCSNIQAWVEHDYDTRILMRNISFPLLRELSRAGDPVARRVFKEEIALRLESGYPSVVQYLLNQGYISNFTATEFRTIIESTGLIKNLSSSRNMLSQFLISCGSKFPTLLGDIVLQILELPRGKEVIISSISSPADQRTILLSRYLNQSPNYLFNLKNALEKLFTEVDEKVGEDIIDIINIIDAKLAQQKNRMHGLYGREGLGEFQKKYLDALFLKKKLEQDDFNLFANKIVDKIDNVKSKCSYCGKNIPKGQNICDWCGHKKDDDEGGFFPYPFIFKPPGGGGGSMKGVIAVPVKTQVQT